MTLLGTGLTIDYTIPAWGIVCAIIGGAGAVSWIIIELIFFKKQTYERMTEMEEELQYQKTKNASDKRELENKMDSINKEFSETKIILKSLDTKMDMLLSGKYNFKGDGHGK